MLYDEMNITLLIYRCHQLACYLSFYTAHQVHVYKRIQRYRQRGTITYIAYGLKGRLKDFDFILFL